MPALPALQGPANKSERKQNRDKFLQRGGLFKTTGSIHAVKKSETF